MGLGSMYVPPGAGVVFYDNAVLTIDGVSSPVTDVSVSFDADATEQCAPLNPSPIVFTTHSEWIPAFQAWHDRIMLEPMPLGYDEFTRHRDRPRWLRLGLRRAKAKAKRAKMRAARYAARWEQAHLRGGKS